MRNCVNRSTKEFKALAEQSDINPIILAAKVSLWQDSNGLDKFPTLQELNGNVSKTANITQAGLISQLKKVIPEREAFAFAINSLPGKKEINYKDIKPGNFGLPLERYFNKPENIDKEVGSAYKIYNYLKEGGILPDNTLLLDANNRIQDGNNRLKAQLALGVENFTYVTTPKDFFTKSSYQVIAEQYLNDNKEVVDKVNSLIENTSSISDMSIDLSDSTQEIKLGVEDLFDSNPELTNAVYESLGFKVKSKIEATKTPVEIRNELFSKQERGQISLAGEDVDIISQSRTNPTEENIEELKKIYNDLIGNLQDSIINEITPQQKQQALQQYSAYLDSIFPDSQVKDIVYHGTNKDFSEFVSGKGFWGNAFYVTTEKGYANSIAASRARQEPGTSKIIKPLLINANNIEFEEDAYAINEFPENIDTILTNIEGGAKIIYAISKPEQIHILGSKQDIKGFKEFVKDNEINQEADLSIDLFDNSSITSKDKIIFGHPTIGKTFLKESGRKDFISLDDDYGQEIKDFVDANKKDLDKYQYQESKPQEFIDFTLALYDRVKLIAQKENKKLFTSNNIILENRMKDFDKVINLSRDEFFNRIGKRNTTYDVKAWKDQIDNLISKVDKSKVIDTDKYLSDLLKSNFQVDLSIDLFENTNIDVSSDLKFELKNDVLGPIVRKNQKLVREHLAFKFSTDKEGREIPYLEVSTPSDISGPTQIIIKETAVKIKNENFAGVASRLINEVNKAVLHPDAIRDGKTVGTINKDAPNVIDIQAFPEYILNYSINYSNVTSQTNSSAIKYRYLSDFLANKGLTSKYAAQLAELYKKGNVADIIETEKRILEERASMEMEVFQEDLSFDLNPDLSIDLSYNNNDGIYSNPNFNRVKVKRKSQIASLETRIEKLKDFRKTKGEIENITARINYLTNLKVELEQDLKNFENAVSEEDKFNQVKEIFERDIAQVKELLKNPNVENVAIAKDMIDYIEINSDQENEHSIFGIEKGEITNPTITTLKEYLHTEKQELKKLYETATDEAVVDYLDPLKDNIFKLFPKGALESDREALARIRDTQLYKNIDDIDTLEKLFFAQGDTLLTESDLIAKIQVLMYESELHKTLAEATILKQKLNAILPRLEERLKQLGYISKGPVDYLNYISLFYARNQQGFSEPYIVGKFTSVWENYLYNINQEARESFKNLYSDTTKRNIGAEIDAILLKKYTDINSKADFVDFRYLHDVFKGIPYFDTDIYKKGTDQEAEAYKQELKNKIGESEYDEIIRKQTNFLREFQHEADSMTKKYVDQKGRKTYDELSDKEKITLDHNIDRIDPFVLIDLHTSGNKLYVPYIQGYTNNHYMKYNTLIPKREDSNGNTTSFYDTNFEIIEKDPVLNEAWKIMKDIVEYNNINLIGSGLNLNKKSLLWFKKGIKEALLNKSWKNTFNREVIKDAFKDTINFIGSLAAAPTQKDTVSKNIVLPNHIASFKKQVEETHNLNKIAIANLFKIPITPATKINFNNLNSVDRISVFETLGVIDEAEFLKYVPLDKDGNFSLKSLYEIAKKSVFESQTLDLPLMLKVQLEQAAIHSARSKTREKLNVLLDKAKSQQKQKQKGAEGESLARTNAEQKTDFFVRTAIENKPSIAHKGTKFNLMSAWARKIKKAEEENKPIPLSEWKRGLNFFSQTLSSDERKKYKTILERLETIEELLSQSSTQDAEENSKLEKYLLDEKAKLEQHIRLIGKDFMASVLLTNTMTTFQILKGMGYAVVSPFFNYVNGRIQLKNRDGEFWPIGYADIALAFVDMRAARIFDKNYAKQWSIGEAIVERLGIISDATNEFQRGERKDVGGSPKFFGRINIKGFNVPAPNKKLFTDPLFGTAYVEYFNQLPAFYAHSLNKGIKNVITGEEERFFDGTSFVAYDIEEGTGKVILKPQFDSEENRRDFLNFTSDSAASWVSEIKTSIDSLNGNYRNSGVTMIKDNIFGKQLMAFKSWVPKLLESKFAYNQVDMATGKIRDGHITGSLVSPDTKAQGVATLMQITAANAVFGAVTLAGASGGLLAVATGVIALASAIALPAMAIKTYNKVVGKTVQKSPAIYTNLYRAIKQTLLTNTVGMVELPTNAAYAMLKKLRIVNSLTDQKNAFEKDVSMEKAYLMNPYAMIANYDKLSQRNLQSIRGMVTTAVISTYSSIIMALMSELGGDEEEKENTGQEGTDLKRWHDEQAQKDLDKDNSWQEKARIGVKNTSGRILNEATTGYDPINFAKMFIGDESTALEGSPALVIQLGEIVLRNVGGEGEADVFSDPTSMYYGDSKTSVALRRNLLFSTTKNLGKDEWALGIESVTEKDYYKNNYDDWFNETNLKSDQKKFKPAKLERIVELKDEIAQQFHKTDFKQVKVATNREGITKEAERRFKVEMMSPKDGVKGARGFYTKDQRRIENPFTEEYFKQLDK